MNLYQLTKHVLLLGSLLLLVWTGSIQAAVFNLVYDDLDDGIISPADIVGTGIFSYDGPAMAGDFLLSELTGVNYSSTFAGITGTSTFSGPPFDPSDLSLIGISVTDIGGGVFDLIFTGDSAVTSGSMDVENPNGSLSHQPAPLLGGGVGPNLYFAGDPSVGLDAYGDYAATTVPLPPAIFFLATGLFGLMFRRRRG